MLTKETPKEQVQLELSKLPICPLTQKKIVYPVLVYTEIPGKSYLKAYFYEHTALIEYIKKAVQQNKSLVTPITQESIVDLLKLDNHIEIMQSIYDMALHHGIVTEAFIKDWQEKVEASRQWIKDHSSDMKYYDFIRAKRFITSGMSKSDIEKRQLAIPECPITQEKIVFPVEVFAEVVGSVGYNVYFYEAVAFMDYCEDLKKLNKPQVTPDTREPIVDFFDSKYLFESMGSIYDAALRLGLMTQKEMDEWRHKVKQTQLWISLYPRNNNMLFQLVNPSSNSTKDRVILLNTPHYFTDELPLAVVIRYARLSLSSSLRLEIFDYLQSLGADASKTNAMGDTLLMVAAKHKNLHFFDRLLTTIDPNAKNMKKETALHTVVSSITDVQSTLHMLKSAIDCGADPTIQNNKNKDVLEILTRTTFECDHPPSKLHLIDLCDQFFAFLMRKHPHIIFNYATKKNDFALAIMLARAGAYDAVKSVLLAGYPMSIESSVNGVVGSIFTHLIKIAVVNREDILVLNKLARLVEFYFQTAGYLVLGQMPTKQLLSVFEHPMIKPLEATLDSQQAINGKDWLFILSYLRMTRGGVENKKAREIFTHLLQEKERTKLYVLMASEIALRLYPRCDIKSFTVFESNNMLELSFLKMIIYCNNEVVLPVILKLQSTPVDIKTLADYAISLGYYHLLPHLKLNQDDLKVDEEISMQSSATLFHHPTASSNTITDNSSTLSMPRQG